MRVIFYDTETTGTRPEKDRIIEIAAAYGDTGETFVSLVNPGVPIPPEASAVSGITDAMIVEAPPFAEVGRAFASFCGASALLVAHNNDAFDKLFLESEFARAALPLPPWQYLDTLKWSRKYRPDLPRHALQSLRKAYGIEANQAHRALDDVVVLREVFRRMVDDLPIETVIHLLATPEKKPTKMPFGKHQGKALSAVPKDYVRWLANNGVLDKPEHQHLRTAFAELEYL